MNATRRDLEIQFKRVVDNGWLWWFQREAKRAGTTTAHLLGIGSRETNLKNIKGDFRNGLYNGFGILQVDIGTDANYARTWTPANVEPSIVRGVDIYLSKVRDTKNSVGKRVGVRSRFFTGRGVDAEDLRRIATAAYNCGRWAHYHFSNGQNVDTTTTGDDYSRDVYDRAVEFADILEERGYEKMAIHRELTLQGKYARIEHRGAFQFDELPERLALPAGQPREAQEELTAVDYERDSIADDEGDLLNLFGDDTASTVADPAGSENSLPNEPSFTPVGSPDAEAGPGSLPVPAALGNHNVALADTPVEIVKTESVSSPDGTRKVEETVTTTKTQNVVIEKHESTGFFSSVWKKITGLSIFNAGLDGVSEKAQQFQAFGLSQAFWTKLIYIALAASVAYLLFEAYKHFSKLKEEKERDTILARENSSEGNFVQFAPTEFLQEYRNKGYKIITR